MSDSFMSGHGEEITSLAARYRLPTVYPFRFFTEKPIAPPAVIMTKGEVVMGPCGGHVVDRCGNRLHS